MNIAALITCHNLRNMTLVDKCHRIAELDCIRAMAIYLVVFGHSLCHLRQTPFSLELIYSFHMPVMFSISGFSAALAWNKGGSCHALRRIGRSFNRLLVPYAVVGLLIAPIWTVVTQVLSGGDVSWQSTLGIWWGYFHSFFIENHGLWFLPACFILIFTQILGETLGCRWCGWTRIGLGAGMIIPIAILYSCSKCDFLRSVMCYWFSFYAGVVLYRFPSLLIRPSCLFAAISFSVWAVLAVIFAQNAHTLVGNLIKPFTGLAALAPMGWLAHHLHRVTLLSDIGKSTLSIYCVEFVCGYQYFLLLAPSHPVQSALHSLALVLVVHYMRTLFRRSINECLDR